jgi:hypothetical protein
MGLDATVYCDCFEAGNLKEPPPCPNVSVSDNGSLECSSEDLDMLFAFDQWLLHRACAHPDGILLHHRFGHLAQVELLRSELEREDELFPVLLGKVLYSGTHAGDHLASEDIVGVQSELEQLKKLACLSGKNQSYVDNSRAQMVELVEMALRVGKPISF